MDEDLCIHEMLPGTCEICLGREQRRGRKTTILSGPTTHESGPSQVPNFRRLAGSASGDTRLFAQFESQCFECHVTIEVGDSIAQGPTGYFVHEECA